jgi:LysR family transcriptional regulator for bpeEF and oprC
VTILHLRARLGRVEYQLNQALEELQAFVAVVDAQGFSAAARATRGRKATLSRRVQDLEARLGVQLLVRTTRSMRLTEEGSAYYEHASRALALARDAEAAVLSAKAEPRGMLRVTTVPSLAALIVEDVVVRYLAKHPQVRMQLHVTERRLDIIREGFDLAVWGGALGDSSLVARKLGLAAGGYFASPSYLARRPEPKSPDELASHDLVTITKGRGTTEWKFQMGGKPKPLAIRPRLVVDDAELAARAAAAGLGIAPAPMAIAQRYLEKKTLVAILSRWTPPPVDVYAVFPPGGALVQRTRAFVDMLQTCFERGARRAR